MRWFLLIILTLIGALLEAGNLLNTIALGQWSIRPAVLIVLLVFLAAQARTREALIASFIIGLAMDISGSLMGPHTVSYVLIGGLVHQFSEHVKLRRVTHQAAMIFMAYLAAEIVAYWLGAVKTGEFQAYAYRVVLLTGFYSACLGPFIWRLLQPISRNLISHVSPSSTPQGYLR